jgi:hypothetical protein
MVFQPSTVCIYTTFDNPIFMMKYLILLLIFAPGAAQAQLSVNLLGGLMLPAEAAGEYFKPGLVSNISLCADFDRGYVGLGLGQGSFSQRLPGYMVGDNSTYFKVTLPERSQWKYYHLSGGWQAMSKPRWDAGVGAQVGVLTMSGIAAESVARGPFGTSTSSTESSQHWVWGPQIQFRYFIIPSIALMAQANYLVYKRDGLDRGDFMHPSEFYFNGTLGQIQVGITLHRGRKSD